jgi:hypothetical protein
MRLLVIPKHRTKCTVRKLEYLNNVFASHCLHQVFSFVHDHAFHA